MVSVSFKCLLLLLYCVANVSLFNLGNSKFVGSGGGNTEHRLATRLCPKEFNWSVLIHLILSTPYSAKQLK